MKSTIFALLAFGGLFANTIANPIGAGNGIVERQDEDYTKQGVALEDLYTKVLAQTAQINKTVNAVPENPTEADTDAAAAAVAPQLQAIASLLSDASGTIMKRAIEAPLGWKKPDIFVVVSKLLFEILFTVKLLLLKLGLGKVLLYISPLVLSLIKLVKSLDKVVGGLLIAVKDIVNELLKAVGLGLLGLL